MTNIFVSTALDELEQREKDAKYFNDIRLWAKDKLGYHLWNKQVAIAENLVKHRRVAVKSGHGVGKGLTLTTPLPTPSGWTTVGAVRAGDEILDEQGRPTTVTAVSPEWYRDCYRVTFDDGTFVDTNDVHEWNVTDMNRRHRGRRSDWRDHWDCTYTMETQEMYQTGLRTSAGQLRFRVPNTRSLQLPEAPLPIDPYLLGFWLGDGTSSTASITIGVPKLGLLDHLSVIGQEFEITDNTGDKNSYIVRMRKYGLYTKLQSLDLIGNKHIPQTYLRASSGQREALLAGLMDSDGFKGNASSVGMDTTSKTMAEGIYELLVSLGIKVRRAEGVAAYTKNGKRHIVGTRYRLNWRPVDSPFKYRDEWVGNTAQQSRTTQRTIVDIQPIESEPTLCLSVDSPSHLYLAGEGMVPTHNSFVASIIVAWFIDTRKDLDALAVSTAPTQPQLGIVWEYVRDHQRKGDLFGRITLDNEWKSDSDVLRGMGRKPSNTNEHAFQGQHRRNGVLAVIDEACGIPESLFTGVDAITTGAYDFALAVGNPDDINTPFGRIWTGNDDSWHKMTISSYDSPNMTGEYFPADARGGLVSAEWIEGRRKAWGEDSPRFKSKVLGEFSEGSTNTLFTMADLLKGHSTELFPDNDVETVLGCDIARYGSDETVVYANRGGIVRQIGRWGKTDLVTTAEKINELAFGEGATQVRVDGVGIGAGVIDNLARLADDRYEVVGMIGNASSPDLDKWANARAYWYDSAREAMSEGKLDIDIEDKQLADELGDVQYHFRNTRSVLQIEKKEEIRMRTEKSPDYADAFIYSVANLDFDPADPLSKLKPGDELELDYEALMGELFEIGPGGGW